MTTDKSRMTLNEQLSHPDDDVTHPEWSGPKGPAKTALKARPTVYRGIRMRSRLEAGFAAWLDRWEVQWAYEPRAYATEAGQYLPDFELFDIPKCGVSEGKLFVEVKPQQPDLETIRSMGRILYASEPEAVLVAVWPDGLNLKSMGLASDGSYGFMVWTHPPEASGCKIALDATVQPHLGPWYGEYWKPEGSPR